MSDDAPPPVIDVPIAVGVGLVASFVQSLGLTLQRRSHIDNAAHTRGEQRGEWQRPQWVAGFLIFLCANVAGTLFQISALPVVILAPLGAVSLLYNALLARVLLGAMLSRHMLRGTLLIAAGALLIGCFGALPERARPLDELIALYERPQFVVTALLTALTLGCVVAMAHLTELQLHLTPAHAPPRPPRRLYSLARLAAPRLATVAEVSESSSGASSPLVPAASTPPAAPPAALTDGSAKHAHGSLPADPEAPAPAPPRATAYGTLGRGPPPRSSAFTSPAHHQTVMLLAIAYSATSGTLAGICLLLAKAGVGLLVLTVQGHSQFGSWTAWMIAAALAAAALLQLWYLNKGLRLADPVVVCPTAFCFYNTSSIALGLVYFAQLDTLTWTNTACVATGTAVLLAGVWAISLPGDAPDAPAPAPAPSATRPAWPTRPTRPARRPSISLDGEPTLPPTIVTLIERGLSIGLSPSSPGFHVLPVRS